jgi:hypothetical protein
MFEPMLRNIINNKVFIFTDEFQSEGCDGCAFQYDRIACCNAPGVCNEQEGIWAEVNLQVV